MFTSRHVKHSRLLLRHARKYLRYKHDVLSDADREQIVAEMQVLRTTLRGRDRQRIHSAAETLDKTQTCAFSESSSSASSYSRPDISQSKIKKKRKRKNKSLCFQHLDECLLRDIDLPDALHSFLSFFLFLQQLPLTRDIAAVAFRGYIFSQC